MSGWIIQLAYLLELPNLVVSKTRMVGCGWMVGWVMTDEMVGWIVGWRDGGLDGGMGDEMVG